MRERVKSQRSGLTPLPWSLLSGDASGRWVFEELSSAMGPAQFKLLRLLFIMSLVSHLFTCIFWRVKLVCAIANVFMHAVGHVWWQGQEKTLFLRLKFRLFQVLYDINNENMEARYYAFLNLYIHVIDFTPSCQVKLVSNLDCRFNRMLIARSIKNC